MLQVDAFLETKHRNVTGTPRAAFCVESVTQLAYLLGNVFLLLNIK